MARRLLGISGVVVVCLALFAPSIAGAQSSADKKKAKAHFEQGQAFFEAEVYDMAIREFKSAYSLVSAPGLLFNIARCYEAMEDRTNAITFYERYLKVAPEGSVKAEAMARSVALKRAMTDEQSDAASKAAKDAAEQAKATAEKARNDEEAQKRAAVDEHLSNARKHLAAKRFDLSIAEFQTAYRLGGDSEVVFEIAETYRLKGDRDRALNAYGRYLEIAPSGRYSKDANEQVAALTKPPEKNKTTNGDGHNRTDKTNKVAANGDGAKKETAPGPGSHVTSAMMDPNRKSSETTSLTRSNDSLTTSTRGTGAPSLDMIGESLVLDRGIEASLDLRLPGFDSDSDIGFFDFGYLDAGARIAMGKAELAMSVGLLVKKPDFADQLNAVDRLDAALSFPLGQSAALSMSLGALDPLAGDELPFKRYSMQSRFLYKRAFTPKLAVIGEAGVAFLNILWTDAVPQSEQAWWSISTVFVLRGQFQPTPRIGIEAYLHQQNPLAANPSEDNPDGVLDLYYDPGSATNVGVRGEYAMSHALTLFGELNLLEHKTEFAFSSKRESNTFILGAEFRK